jgi:PTS system nitrogen regulatory IIA component
MHFTVRDAAKLLQTTEKQIYGWVDEGDIPYETVNEQVRFNRSELLEWATLRRLPIAPDVFRQGNLEDELPWPSLAEALAAGGVHRIDAKDREGVLGQVVAVMPLRDEGDRELLFQVLIAREGMGSTAVGDGIAIPHVRAPAVFHEVPASITLCFLEHPVDFAAPDGLPVHTLFSIVSPNVRGHLEMLAKLATALHDRAFKAALQRRAGLDELVTEARRLGASSTKQR